MKSMKGKCLVGLITKVGSYEEGWFKLREPSKKTDYICIVENKDRDEWDSLRPSKDRQLFICTITSDKVGFNNTITVRV